MRAMLTLLIRLHAMPCAAYADTLLDATSLALPLSARAMLCYFMRRHADIIALSAAERHCHVYVEHVVAAATLMIFAAADILLYAIIAIISPLFALLFQRYAMLLLYCYAMMPHHRSYHVATVTIPRHAAIDAIILFSCHTP